MNLEINYLKNSKGLFVFSDPGGAKPLLSFIKNYKLKDFIVISDRSYDFFLDFEITVISFRNQNILDIIKDFNPDYLLTGTSYTSKIELKFIKEAKKLGINTYSYIDHYLNYKERFVLEKENIFPNKILLIDNIAKKIALKNNLSDHSSLIVCNNFYHDFLKNWSPNTERKNFINNLLIKSDQKIIVFAPDPLSNINGKEKYLFDENDIWNDLAFVLKKIKSQNLIIVIKFHPNQIKEPLIKLIQNSNITNVVYYNQSNTIDLLYHSDVIIGMFSSILIEANIFKKKIIRHFPNLNIYDPLSKLDIGLKSNNKKELFNNMLKYI